MTDTALEVNQEPCPDCGRPYTPRIKKLGGRSEDYLYSPEKGWTPPAIITFPLKSLKAIRETQLIQRNKNALIIRYSLRPEAEPGLVVADLDQIQRGLRHMLGKEMKFHYEETDSFPRGPTGKFKWVNCELEEAPRKTDL